MIDIHSHILPGLDDGARTQDEAVNMVRMAASAGTTDIVATPHANEQFCFDPMAAAQRIAVLQQACGETPRIHYGCELHLTPDNIEDALRFPARYSIAHRAYLLIEFSDFWIPKTAGEILQRLMAAGMRPILAHPERNPILRGRFVDLAAWVEQGCLLQVTAQSLTGSFGRTAKSASEQLMRLGLVHLLASDGHDTRHRPPVLDAAWQYLEDRFGQATAQRLLVETPRAILEGQPVEAAVPIKRKKSRFALW
ncbi:MAG TPA: CpsB/CapC family capsule biosynthesis tyrosine phosphatase [Bryobacteraceae bacterium]|nr:CpsB/CapC family capsule biosynthesis tyrosine phosphatase [Bryobacteraceae bacterium]